jgi:hypothetical protein
MDVVSYESAMHDEWNELVSASPNGTFLQSRRFLDLQETRWRQESLVLVAPVAGRQRIEAVLCGVVVDDQFMSHKGATHGGVIFRQPLGLTQAARVTQLFAERLRKGAFRTWTVTPVPVFLRRLPWEGDLYGYWRLHCRLVGRGGSSYLPAGMPLGRRKNRALATRAGVTCQESDSLDVSYGLIREVISQRHGVEATHTIQELKLLVATNPDHVLVVEAVREAEVIAASVLFRMPSAIHFQYMGANASGREFQALDAVVQHVWKEVRSTSEGISFGVSTTEYGQALNEGLASFKEGFGALPRTLDSYEILL